MDAAVAMALVYHVKKYLSVKHAQLIDMLLENISTGTLVKSPLYKPHLKNSL